MEKKFLVLGLCDKKWWVMENNSLVLAFSKQASAWWSSDRDSTPVAGSRPPGSIIKGEKFFQVPTCRLCSRLIAIVLNPLLLTSGLNSSVISPVLCNVEMRVLVHLYIGIEPALVPQAGRTAFLYSRPWM